MDGYLTLDSQLEETPLVAEYGQHGVIIEVAPGLVGKFPKDSISGDVWEENFHGIRKEARISQYLHENGISVPVPYGMFRCDVRNADSDVLIDGSHIGFVMQKIEGERVDFLDKDIRSEATRLAYEEFSKAYDLGLNPVDDTDVNAIRENKTGKVYIFDFFQWTWR